MNCSVSTLKDIEDLLCKCKKATSFEIAEKLGLPIGSCKIHLNILRRINPHIVAKGGKHGGYEWIDKEDADNTGMSAEVLRNVEKVRQLIKDNDGVSGADIARHLGVTRHTASLYVQYLRFSDNVVRAPHSILVRSSIDTRACNTNSEDSDWFIGRVEESRVIDCLSEDNPLGWSDIGTALGVNGSGVGKYINKLVDEGLVVRTKSGTYVLKSDCPSDRLSRIV